MCANIKETNINAKIVEVPLFVSIEDIKILAKNVEVPKYARMVK
jgi:hypothetical protein